MNAVFGYIARATKRLKGRVLQSPLVIVSVGDSAGNNHLELLKILKTAKMQNIAINVHFERDDVDVYKRGKLFRKLSSKRGYFCHTLRNLINGSEFEKDLSKVLDLVYDWFPKVKEVMPSILEKISARKGSVLIMILSSGGHSIAGIAVAKELMKNYSFSHTVAVIVKPEDSEKRSSEIYQKLISYLDKANLFETMVSVESKSVNNNFKERDVENMSLIASLLQKNLPDNFGHLCPNKDEKFHGKKKWYEGLVYPTTIASYKTWFSKKHHQEGGFEPLAVAIKSLNGSGKVDVNSIYTFFGDLKRTGDIDLAFAKVQAENRDNNIKAEIRQFLIKIRSKPNVFVGRLKQVSLKKFVNYSEFEELDYILRKEEENDSFA
ncbi:MAG TPA: hypothetical protein VND01_00435 [Candidatus Acidoferrales bacterium]|nr:hypothetical protein [Candidatus Acidoferrales bacterium]